MSKRVLCILLSILMLVSMMPMATFAAVQNVSGSAINIAYDDVSIQSVTVSTTDDGDALNPTYTHILTIVPQDGYSVDNINAASWNGAVELLGYVDLGNNQYQIVSQNQVEVSVNASPDPTKDEIEVRFEVDGDLYAYDVITKGETPLVPATAPVKDGYTFAGWKAASSGTVYTGTPDALTASETYTAEFELGTHTLTYYRGTEADASDYKCVLELPGGTIVELYNNDGVDHPTYDVTDVAYGSAIELGTPALPGYTFAGWKDASGYIHPAGALYTVKGDVTLTATWTTAENKEDCLVRFVSDGTVYDAFLTYNGQTISIPAVDPVIAGKVFGGWEYAGNVYSNTGVKTLDVVADANREMILTAVWTDATYNVTYSGEGVSIPAATDLPYGKYVIAAAPEREGYTFIAWEDTATGAYYDANSAITLDSDLSLNAVWAAESVQYTVKFYAEDGSLYDIEIVENGATITAPDYTAGKLGNVYQWIDEVNRTYADAGDTITVDKNLVYKIKLVSEATYGIVMNVSPAELSSAVTVPTGTFAEGQQVMINIAVPDGYVLKSVDTVGGNNGESVALSRPVVDSLQHIVGPHYNYYFYMPAAKAIISVEFEKIPVGSTVAKFVTDGDLYDYVMVTKGTNGTAPAVAPVKTGYTFNGWVSGNITVQAGAPFAVAADADDEIVFEASWTADSYTVNYDTVGGEPQPMASAHNYEDEITLEAAPAKDGFEFIGWVENSTGFVYAAGATYTVKGDAIFTAKWEEIPAEEFIVRFVDKDTNQIFGYEIVKDGETVVAPAGPSFGGKSFVAWEDAGIQVLAGNPTRAITADTTYYATYDINTHSVTSVVEQCVVNPNSLTNVPVGTLVEFDVTANAKYKVESVVIAYNDGMSIVTKTLTADNAGKYSFYMPDADVTITAVAKQNEFSIFPQPEAYAQITAPTTAEVGDAVVFNAVSIDADYVLSNVVVTTASGVPVAVSTYITGGTTSYLFEMPAADVLIYAQIEQAELSVTFLDDDNTLLGIVPVGSGDLVTAPDAAKDGYTFDGWVILPDGTDFDPATDVVTEKLIVRATYVGDAHTVAAGLIDNLEALSAKCTISSGNENSSDLLQTALNTALNAETGKTVYFTVAAEFGYMITDIAVVSAAGTNLVVEPTLREKEVIDNITYYTYSFTMPAEDVKLDIYTVPMSFKVSVIENIAEGGDYTINGFFTSNLMVAQGDDVAIAVTAANGYNVKNVSGSYIDNLGNVADLGGVWDGTAYTFKMIAKDVTIVVEYEANEYVVDVQTSNFETYKPDASVNPAEVVESLDADLTSKGIIEIVGGATENYTNAGGQIYAIPANGVVTVGTRIGFTVTEYTGYDLANVTVTYDNGEKSCVITEKEGVYYFDMPADDVVITATFVEETYKVIKDATAEEHGSITVNNLKENIVAADYKEEVEVVVTPDAGYQITNIYYELADGTVLDFDAASYTPAGTIVDDVDVAQSITFHMPASEVTVYAEYEKIDYTVSAVYTAEQVDVTYYSPKNVGDQVAFKTDVKHGYFINKVYVVNDATGNRIDCFTAETSEAEIYGATYRFEMPASSVTIYVATVKDEYAVKYYDAGGLVGYEDIDYKTPANVDEYIPEVVNAKPGYHFIGWYSADVENPVDISAPSVDKNDFIVVQKTTIRAAYAKDEIDVVFNATENGTVTCNGNTAAYTLDTTVFGDQVEFIATPDEGYVIDTVSVTTTDADGYNLDVRYAEDAGKYTFTIPATYKDSVHTIQAEDVIVTVTFKKDTFTLTRAADCETDGTIAVNGKIATEISYNYLFQDAVTITATPDNGYYVSKITAVGATKSYEITGTAPAVDTASGDALTLSFNMPAEDLVYKVEYKKINYSIDVATTNAANADYGVVAKDVETAVLDQLVTLTVTEKTGYDLESLTVTTKTGVTVLDLSELIRVDNVVTTTFEMPAEAVVVTATYIPEVYEVIKHEDCQTNGSVAINGAVATQNSFAYDYNTDVTITATPDAGYYVTDIIITKADGTEFKKVAGTAPAVDTAAGAPVTIEFVMPAYDLYYTVKYAKINYSIDVATTNAANAAYGVVAKDVETAVLDQLVTLTVTEKTGYDLESLTVTTKNGVTTIDLSELVKNGNVITTTFEMPAEAVVVTATYTTEKYDVIKGAGSEANGKIESVDTDGVTNLQNTYLYDFGDSVKLKITADDGWYVASVKATGKTSGSTLATFTGTEADTTANITFTMPAEDVEITVVYAEIVYDINTVFEATEGSVVTAPAGSATVDDLVAITVTPAEGYHIKDVFVVDANGKHIALSTEEEGKYHFTMPAADVTVTATFEKNVYTVTFMDWNGDMLKVDYVDYKDAATAPADPAREGYTFTGWDVDFSSITADLTVTAQYEIINSKLEAFSISFTGNSHGTVTLPETADYGEVITVVANPDEGWRFDTISVAAADGSYVPVSFVKTDANYVTTLSFVMPDCDVSITVSFREHSASKYTDTRTDDWYYAAVEFVTDRGYFVGVSDTLFAPNTKMSRAMFVAVLARLDGVDLSAYKGTDFADVAVNAYYAPAVKWASENGIVRGYSKTEFAPDKNVTREEMCAIMYRYANYLGLNTDMQNAAFLNRYTDLDQISAYAKDAVEWAVGTGLVLGMSKNTIDPKGYATRAQVAQIVKNLCDKVIYE